MQIIQEKPVTVKDVIEAYLDQKITNAIALKDRFRGVSIDQDDDYTRGQKLYAEHLIAALKWARSQVPKKLSGELVMNNWSIESVMKNMANRGIGG